jgi:ketosteroid isomerase-like protein
MQDMKSTLNALFESFDRKDFAAMRAMLTDDAQGVDEISRHWLRDAGAINSYFDQLGPMVSDIRSEVSQVQHAQWGDVGLSTCWLEQDYVLQGEPQHISAPASILMRRVDNDWRVALVHAVPMPPEG